VARADGTPGAAGTDERAQWLARGEAALTQGDAAAAQESFQRAALMAHAADTECSIVRAHMQAGEYRRALAFGAHTAYAHRDFPGGAALYAWLLHAGGQGEFAQRKLDEAAAFAPDDAALRTARDQLAQPWPHAHGALLAQPLRIAPYAHGMALPSATRCVGTALLIDEGRAALLPRTTLGAATQVWLRNGLGSTVLAALDTAHRDVPPPLARLQLAQPLPAAAGLQGATREPFAGSAGSMVEYAPSSDGAAAWPLLRFGFIGRRTASDQRLLGLPAPRGPRGGPVFDAAGRVAGLALHDADGTDCWLPLAALHAALPTPSAGVAAPQALDAVYETGLRAALQVLILT
jgi:hypothetical protein